VQKHQVFRHLRSYGFFPFSALFPLAVFLDGRYRCVRFLTKAPPKAIISIDNPVFMMRLPN
ncbi:hypothetical protein, partial [uncultured Oscillibacter sp.]|uniref:hypothetical protein n=1 Tax=uncultured Oscillibacter sp. TaxID=876091 RepID=UPI0025D4AD1C